MRHRDESIRELAATLFGTTISANRREVAAKYAPAVAVAGNAERGRAVFKRVCAKCHRLGGEGTAIGPDITDVRNRPRDALLHDILDPNRKVEPRFMAYSVVTTRGRLFNGLFIGDFNHL